MAGMNGGNINFGINMTVNKNGLNQILKPLQQIQNRLQTASTEQLKNGFDEAARSAKQLESIINSSWNDKLGQLNLDKFNQGIKASYGNVEGLKNSLTGAGAAGQSAFNALASQVLNTNLQLKESNKLLDDMATSMANTVKWGITSSIFNNITGSIQQAFYYAKDLDRSLNDIRIVTGDSADQMDRFAKTANSAARDLGRSTLDYTNAALSFYQQGLSDDQVAARTQATLKAQNITGVGTEMVDYLTAVWNGFGANTEEIEGYVDKLAKVADSSASDMSELAIAMSKVASMANVMGVDVDQLSAQLATVIAVTRQAPESVGTAFKTIYSRLNDIKAGADDAQISLGNYSGKMADLGFNVLDANGNLRETGQVIEQIGSRWNTLSREQQISLAQIMGGTRQVNQITTLFENWTMYSQLLNDSLSAQGTLNEKNDVYLESTAAHMKELATETERTYDILFDQDTVNGFTDIFRDTLNLFNNFIEGLGGGANVFAYFGSLVSGIFNKQIAESILGVEKNFQRFMANLNATKIKKDFIENIKKDLQGAFAGDGIVLSDQALKKQANYTERFLAIQKGLTVEQQKQTIQLQKKIALSQQRIEKLQKEREEQKQKAEAALTELNYTKTLNEYDEKDLKTLELSAQNDEKIASARSKSLSVLYKIEYEGKEILKNDQARGEILHELRSYSDNIYQIAEKQGKSGQEYVNILERAKIEIKTQSSDLTNFEKILELINNDETLHLSKLKNKEQLIAFIKGELEKEQEQEKKHLGLLQQAWQRLINLGKRGIDTQNIIKGMSSAGQILSSWAGAAKTFGDEMATAQQKANATISSIESTISAVGTLFGPIGMGISALVNGIISFVKETTSLGKALENVFKTTDEKVQEINQHFKQANDLTANYRNAKEKISEVTDEFQKLAQKRQKHKNLTEEEESRYYELVDIITTYNEDAIQGYDLKGQKIIDNNTLLQDTLDLLDKQYEKQMRNIYGTGQVRQQYVLKNQQAQENLKNLEEKQEKENNKIKNFSIDDFNEGYGHILDSGIVGGSDVFQTAQNELINAVNHFADWRKTQSDLDINTEESIKQINNFITALEEYKTTIANLYGEYPGLVKQVDNFISSFIPENLTAQIASAQTDAEQAFGDLSIDSVIKNLEFGPNPEAYNTLKEEWGTAYEDFGQSLTYDLLFSFLTGLKKEVPNKDNLKGEDNLIDYLTQYGQQYIYALATIDESIISSAQKQINDLNQKTGQITLSQYNEGFKNILNSLIQNPQIQKLLNDENTRNTGIKIIESILGIDQDSLELNEDNIVTSYGQYIKDTLQKLKEKGNIILSQTQQQPSLPFLTPELTPDQNWDLFIKSLQNNTTYTKQQIDEFISYLENSDKKIKTSSFWNEIDKYFNTKKTEENANNLVQNFDKVTAAINKLQNGKDLKYADKKWLSENLLNNQDLENLETNEDWLEAIIKNVFTLIDDSTQRGQAIDTIFNSFKDLENFEEKYGNILSQQQKIRARASALEGEKQALELTSEKLKLYAEMKGEAYSEENQEQLVRKYKQQQQLLNLQKDAINLAQDVENIDPTSLINFTAAWNELTGSDVSTDWIVENIQAIAAAAKEGITDLAQLQEYIDNYKQPEKSKYDSYIENRDFLQNSKNAYNSLNSGQKLSDEGLNTLAQLQQNNPLLAQTAQDQDGNRQSKEYLEILSQIIEKQNELNQKEKQQLLTQTKRNIETLENEKLAAEASNVAFEKQDELNELYRQEIELQQEGLQKKQNATEVFKEINEILFSGGQLSAEQWASFSEILDDLVENHYPELQASAEILKQEWLAGTQVYRDALKEVGQALAELSEQELEQNLAEALDQVEIGVDSSEFDEWVADVESFLDADKQLAITVHTNAEQEFDYIIGEMDQIYNAASKIGENFIIASEDIRQVGNVFPGILQGMQRLDDGSYQLNSNLVQRAIATAQADVQADKDALKQKLQTQASLYRDKAAIYRKMAEAAGKLAETQVGQEGNAADVKKEINDLLAQQKGKSAELAATSQVKSQKSVIDSSKKNTQTVSKNWAGSMSDAVVSVHNFAAQALPIFAAVATAASAAASQNGQQIINQLIASLPSPSEILSQFSGELGSDSQLTDIEANVADFNAALDSGEGIPQAASKLRDTSLAQAELMEELARQLDISVAELDAKGIDFTEGLDNVYKGQGIKGSKDSNSSRNSSGSGSSKSPSGSSGSSKSPSSSERQKTIKEPTVKEEKIKDPGRIDYLEEEIDRYHDIDIKIKSIDKSLNNLEKTEKKLTGKDLIKNLNQQVNLLEKQIKAYKTKIYLANQEGQELQYSLSQQGVLFDRNTGAITNYASIMEHKLDQVNDIISYYNSLSAVQQQKYKDVVDKAKKDYDNFKKQMADYDKIINETLPGLREDIEEARDKQVEIAISKFNMAIEIELDLSKAKKDWNQFKKKVIDQVRDNDILGNTKSTLEDFFAYYDKKNNSKGLIPSLTKQVTDLMDQVEQINNGSFGNAYGDNKKQALEDLQKYTEELMDNLEDVEDILNDVKESFYDMVDAAQNAFDEQNKEYSFLSDLIQHDKNLIQLLYGEDSSEKIKSYNQQQIEADKRQLDFQKKQKDFWYAKMLAEQKRMQNLDKESNAYKEAQERFKQLEQKWLDSVKDFNAEVQNSIQHLLDQYQNNVKIIFEDLDNTLTNGKGLDYVGEEWELINDNANEYLDTINSMYEIQKLQQAYEDAIEDSDGNLNAQKSLTNLMNQQLKMLKDKDKLTKYDVDRANLLLQIEIKRLALQQSRNSKSKLRLRRDSQGNYTYQYTADNEQISQKEQDLENTRNSLYNLDKDQYVKNQNDILSVQKDFSEKIKKLYEQYPVWTEQAEMKRQLLFEQYGMRINNLAQQNENIRLNLTSSAFDELANLYNTDVNNFINMSTAEQNELMKNLVPQWDTSVQQMTNKIVGEGGLIPSCQQAFDQLDQNTKNYETSLQRLQSQADISFKNIKEGIDTNISRTEVLIEDNGNLIKKYEEEWNALDSIIQQVQKLTQTYTVARTEAIAAAKAANILIEQENKKAAQSSKGSSGTSSSSTGTNSKKINSYDGLVLQDSTDQSRYEGDPKNVKVSKNTLINQASRNNKKNSNVSATSSQKSSGVSSSNKPTWSRILQVYNIINKELGAYGEDSQSYVLSKQGFNAYEIQKGQQLWERLFRLNDPQTLNQAKKAMGYKSGGYTGDWGQEGKLGILHEKELILNAEDTKNILSAVHATRDMSNLLKLMNINGILSNTLNNLTNSNMLETDQKVYINATFPAVNSRLEIEEAFSNLINRASQYSFNTRK